MFCGEKNKKFIFYNFFFLFLKKNYIKKIFYIFRVGSGSPRGSVRTRGGPGSGGFHHGDAVLGAPPKMVKKARI
jgi:hypothetical protein